VTDAANRDLVRALRTDPNDGVLLAAFDAAADRRGLDLAQRVELLCAADATEQATARVLAARSDLAARAQAARVAARDAAIARGEPPCERCHGRGSICTWGTLDSMTGDFDAYGTCPACDGRTVIDFSHWSDTADGRQRIGRGLLALPEGWRVIAGVVHDAAQVAEHDALERLRWVAGDAQAKLNALLRPERGSRVVLVKGRPKNKRTGETVKVGARGLLKWERPAGIDFDESVGFVLDGTEDMVFTARGNLRTENVDAERERRAAATVEREAKLAEVKARDLFKGAIVRGPDGKVGEVFWLKEARLGYRWGKGKEEVTWANADQVERAGLDASRDYRAENPLPRARGAGKRKTRR